MVAASYARAAADDSPDQIVGVVAEFLTDKDKDVRALGLQQVREAAKGAETTKQFAALLPKLEPDAQAELLTALADRGDAAARPAVIELLKSSNSAVRAAALHALGPLGNADDVAALIRGLQSEAKAEKDAARDSLTRLSGDSAGDAIVAALGGQKPAIRAELIGVLAARRMNAAVPQLLKAAQDDDASVRKAAMTALSQLAGPAEIAKMIPGLLKAAPGEERAAAERAVASVAGRIADANKRAAPLIAALATAKLDSRATLLSTIGRIGGPDALKVVEGAIADRDARQHAAGVRALVNWPDATVAAKLETMTASASDPGERTQLLRALIRVAALHDERSNADRLALLKRAMALATTDEERILVIRRVRTVHIIESLRYLLPFLDKAELAQEACSSIVELAHYKDLRDPNKAEFDRALDAVIRTSKDPVVVDHAQKYKKGQTAERAAP